MNIHLLYVAIDAMNLTLLGLVAARFVPLARPLHTKMILLLLVVGVACYVVSARQDYWSLIDPPFRIDFGAFFPVINILRNLATAMFMLLCYKIFRDAQRIPPVLWGAVALLAFLEEPIEWLIDMDALHAPVRFFLAEGLPTLLQLCFIVLSLYWMLSDRDNDLIVERRRMRVWFFSVYACSVVASLGVERIGFGMALIPWQAQYTIHMLLVFLGAMFSLWVLHLGQSAQTAVIMGAEPIFAAGSAEDQEPQADLWAQRLKHLFEEDRLYREPGLTVGMLAERAGLPEYRLRKVIHEQLGFRNFNALLHHYRTAEVAEALRDPEQRATPILTLALSAGYQSLNPFNRAFRDIYDTSPSQYRRAAESA